MLPDVLFVISRCPQEAEANPLGRIPKDCRQYEDAVAHSLSRAGWLVLVVPHLYYLGPTHRAAETLRDTPCDLVVASWLYPRAVYWTLRALGVEGVDTSETTPVQGNGRRISCFRFNERSNPADCAQALVLLAEGAAHGPAGEIEEIPDDLDERWYPVVDYSKCGNCQQCLNFCLFGVYSLAAKRLTVTQPDNCKHGCPACARTCPKGAIIFPHHVKEPVIAGAPSEAGETVPESSHPPGTDEGLDDLINALDKPDE
jgi:NAD-dependent dihydropyrimidine dehydrogenase PreA subunit